MGFRKAARQRRITNKRVREAFEKKQAGSSAELMSLTAMCAANVMFAAENFKIYLDEQSRRTLLYDASESIELACMLVEEVISRLEKSRNVYTFEPYPVGEPPGTNDADKDRANG